MSDFGDDDPYHVERGYKTDSYILAVQGNPLVIQPIPPATNDIPSTAAVSSTPIESGRTRRVKVQNTDGGRSTREVYEAYIVDGDGKPIEEAEERLIDRRNKTTYGALNKDQVDRYRKDGLWSACRCCLIILFILLCLILLSVIIYILALSPKCVRLERGWWTNSVVYEIWTPSFRDSNSDGHGDFAGIGERLSQLKRLGVNVIYPRPFLHTDDTNGLAVIDFEDVQQRNGVIQDARDLIDRAHSYGFKVVIDFPIAATSVGHKWFQRSARASSQENSDYASFYFWKRNIPVSEFVSALNGTDHVYYHVEDHPELPVLNFASTNVSKAIKKALGFWIDQGIDGFHIHYADYLSRTLDGKHPNWRGIITTLHDIEDHCSYHRNMSENEELRDKKIFLFASMSNIGENDKVKLVEKGQLNGVLNSELLQIAVGNKICEKHPDSVGDCANEVIGDILEFHLESEGVWPLWQFGSSQTERLASRTRSRLQAELLLMVELMLPGTPILFYGDELGIQNAQDMTFSQRTAMPWNEEPTAGFSSGDLLRWSNKLPADWKAMNFDSQYADSKSQLRVLKKVIQLRQMYPQTMIDGRTYLSKSHRNSFTVCRFHQNGNETTGEVLVLAVNFGSRPVDISLTDLPPYNVIYKQCGLHDKTVDFEAEIIAISSAVAKQQTYYLRQKIGIARGTIQLGADQGVIFKFQINPPNFFKQCP
ncbi:Alpha-glucosidase [Aphelenchoides besseyi]|nr:Alpha-glucosidase [Aphelenchoides besseyi]